MEIFLGNFFGLHADINLNTGVGARNGNVEVHFLGLGFRAGADGLDVNTPWIGGSNIAAILFLVFAYTTTFHLN
jgi:hypothetical protein